MPSEETLRGHEGLAALLKYLIQLKVYEGFESGKSELEAFSEKKGEYSLIAQIR